MSARASAQRFGTFLSGMIMPNIGAFIAWGLITALFIEAGFTPYGPIGGFGESADGTPHIGMVGPMITYLLPLLIGYTGGRIVHDTRGGVVGAIATMGVIVGADIPMFIGAMIMGPLTAWLMKKVDGLWAGKIKPGFEMLVDNFSAGILGGIMAIVGFFLIGPAVKAFSTAAESVVGMLVDNSLLPLTSLFIEPAKILFLNNAINHGIITPLGTAEAQQTGSSILFLLEANPGPGLGILLAFMVFGRGASRASSFGAALIHFVGGIHEIYFPYVLMKPILVLAVMGGGASGVLVETLLGAGLRAPAAPGSIIALTLMSPPENMLANFAGVATAIVVTFLIAAPLIKFSKNKGEGDLSAATAQMESMKGRKSSVGGMLTGTATGAIRTICFACDAGMGSSAMGASTLRNKIKKAGYPDVTVVNKSIANLTDDYDIVVVHEDLAERARPKAPGAELVTVDNFLNSPRYEDVVAEVERRNGDAAPAPVADVATDDEPARDTGQNQTLLTTDSVVMEGTASDAHGAIDEAGALLVARGAVTEDYVAAMHEREKSVSTFMGEGLAIPHGTNESKGAVQESALSVVRFPDGVDWNGNTVNWVIGIAGKNDEHLELLAGIARIFGDKERVAELNAQTTVQGVVNILSEVGR